MYKGAKYSCCSYNGGGIEADEGIFEIISLTKKQAKFKLIIEPIFGRDLKNERMNYPKFLTLNKKRSKLKKEWLISEENKEKYKKEIEEETKRVKELEKIFILKSRNEKILDFLEENKEFTRYIGGEGIPFNFTLIDKKKLGKNIN